MKRIILAIGSSEIGGAQKVFLSIVTELTKNGVDVIVVLPPGPLVEALKKIIVVKIYIVSYNLISIFKIYKIIKENNIYLINSFLTKCSFIFVVANYFNQVPICCTLLNAITNEKLNSLQKKIYPILYRIIQKLSDGIIVNSYQNKKHFVDVGCMDNNAIDVIYSGVETPSLIPMNKQSEIKKNKLVIGTIGRLSSEKGHKYLLEALKYIEDIEFECWIVGDGPLRKDLEEYVVYSGLTGKVKFWGFRDDVSIILQNIDIVVVPSLDETFGLSIIEAFMHKKIVVATNVGGIPEIVQNMVTGLLVSPRDGKGLAEMIRLCVNDQKSVGFMVDSAFALASEKFTTDSMNKRFIMYYQKLQDRKGFKVF